ncbi:MAG: hypothetical protein OEZ02_02560 [Anaerolineae bacterium]|nr:hypothetical protein [Anaerolineae bacterium]
MRVLKNKSKEEIAIGVIAGLFVVWAIIFILQTSNIGIDGKRYFALFDDAMISMRYGWNLSHGHGLVWNPGEYVEGYSNFLQVLVMALATLVFDKSMAVLAMQIFGMVLILVNAGLILKVADYVFSDIPPQNKAFLKVLAFACALGYYPILYFGLMGMETSLSTLWVLLAVLKAFEYEKTESKAELIQASIYLGLGFLTRPDAGIFAALIYGYVFLGILGAGGKRSGYAALGLGMAVFGLFAGGHTAFRWYYYGELVPNTYLLKMVGMPVGRRIENGWSFTDLFREQAALVFGIALIDTLFRYERKKLLLLSFFVAMLSYQIWIGGDVWRYWRIMTPAMPFLFLLFIQGVFTPWRLFAETKFFREYFLKKPLFPWVGKLEMLVTAVVLVGFTIMNTPFRTEIIFWERPYLATWNEKNINLALALNRVLEEDASIGVMAAGTVPYYTDRYAIDLLGKNDKYIAGLPPDISGTISWLGMNSVPGHNKYDLEYSIKVLKPTWLSTSKYGSQDLEAWVKEYYEPVLFGPYNQGSWVLKGSDQVCWECGNP